jgi:hypothetical protein
MYEVRDEKAQSVMMRIAKRAGWQIELMPKIDAGPTHQRVLISGLGFMYLDRAEEERNRMFNGAYATVLPSGNAPSFQVWNPEAWAIWAINEFKAAGFDDAVIGFAGPNNSLMVVRCKSALGDGAIVFRLYGPLMGIYGGS